MCDTIREGAWNTKDDSPCAKVHPDLESRSDQGRILESRIKEAVECDLISSRLVLVYILTLQNMLI